MSGEELYISHSLVKKTEYTIYRNTIKPEHFIMGRDNYGKFVKEFFDTISEQAIEKDGGVVIRRLGYFYNWLCPRKLSWRKDRSKEDLYSASTDNRQYFPTFIPHEARCEWTMDKTFSKVYKDELVKKIKSGKRYKSYYASLRKAKWI